ncbi:hypothetical protein TNCV_2266641, partial [Trichonephila clavipes]
REIKRVIHGRSGSNLITVKESSKLRYYCQSAGLTRRSTGRVLMDVISGSMGFEGSKAIFFPYCLFPSEGEAHWKRNALKVAEKRQAARNRGGKIARQHRKSSSRAESELNELRLEIESIRSNVKWDELCRRS